MSFGFQIKTDFNQEINSNTFSGIVHATFVVAGNSSGSVNYPELADFTVYAVVQKYASQPSALVETSVSYAPGYPVVSWYPSGSNATPANALILVVIK